MDTPADNMDSVPITRHGTAYVHIASKHDRMEFYEYSHEPTKLLSLISNFTMFRINLLTSHAVSCNQWGKQTQKLSLKHRNSHQWKYALFKKRFISKYIEPFDHNISPPTISIKHGKAF